MHTSRIASGVRLGLPLVAAILLLGGCATSTSAPRSLVSVGPTAGDIPLYGDDRLDARSLKDLVVASDAVIEATVTKVGPGRVVGGGDSGALQLTLIVVNVDSVLSGKMQSDTVFVEDDFTPANQVAPGDTTYMFLHLKDDNTSVQYYRLVSSQGRFIVRDGSVLASNEEDSWIQDLERLSPEEFVDQVNQAIASTSGQAVTQSGGSGAG